MLDSLKSLFDRFRRVPYWVFLLLFIISGIVSITALRHNNQSMIKLREAVYQADKDNKDIESALTNLRSYVYGHMNTDLASGGNAIKPPIQLKYTYERLQAASEQQTNNASLYTEAENYCQQQIPASVSISGRGRIACVQDYILNHGGKAGANVPVSLYQFDFVSANWSPDLAGWSLVISVILLLAFIVSLILDKLVLARLKPI